MTAGAERCKSKRSGRREFLPESPEFPRWRQNCSILRIQVPHTPEELTAITLGLLRRNEFKTDLYIRPLAYKSAERVGVDRGRITLAFRRLDRQPPRGAGDFLP